VRFLPPSFEELEWPHNESKKFIVGPFLLVPKKETEIMARGKKVKIEGRSKKGKGHMRKHKGHKRGHKK
jgi:hypothetical protein